MKNSRGSMIGGIGLTVWARAVQCSRTRARTASTWSSSTPSTIVALDSLRNPPDDCRRVVRNSAAMRASTSVPASSLWTIAITSLTGGVYDRPAVSSDAILQDAIRAVARSRDADSALDDLLGLAVDAGGGSGAAALLWDGDRGALGIAGARGLANARTLARVIELEIVRAARQASDLCVALFDVDNLTAINDGAGRAAGDNVLREVAAVAAESVRLVDTMARWGGDEFILVAPGAKGTTVARRIVEAVAARPAIAGRTFTVSAGIARFPADGTTGDELIAAATAALRAAQAVGPGTFAEAAPAP